MSPQYEYHCERCRETFTVRQTYKEFDENPVDECPECGGRIDQVFSPVPAHYRGEGFSSTDLRDDMVMSESGVMSHRISDTEPRNILEKSRQKSTTKGKPLATATAPTSRPLRSSS